MLSALAVIAGIIACALVYRRGGEVVRFGFWFFVLILIAHAYGGFVGFVVPRFHHLWPGNLSGFAVFVAVARAPGQALAMAAYIMLAVGLYRHGQRQPESTGG